MSETVHYRGILREIESDKNETLEEFCKRLLIGKELPSYFDSYQEMLLDEYYQKYIINNGKLYSVDRQKIDFDEDIFMAVKNKNGDGIDFEVKYYNGGCSFNEAIEEALKKMN